MTYFDRNTLIGATEHHADTRQCMAEVQQHRSGLLRHLRLNRIQQIDIAGIEVIGYVTSFHSFDIGRIGDIGHKS